MRRNEAKKMKGFLMWLPFVAVVAFFIGCGGEGLAPGAKPAPVEKVVAKPTLATFESGKAMAKDAKTRIVQISVVDLKARIDAEEGFLLLDVREEKEYNGGHISGGAINLPRGLLEFKIADAEFWGKIEGKDIPAKDAQIVLYCKTGGRGALSVEALAKLGYKNVKNVDGGWEAWQDPKSAPAGSSPTKSVAAAFESGKAMAKDAKTRITQISVADLKAKTDKGEEFFLIDVRQAKEYGTDHIAGAFNLPRGLLEFKIADSKFWNEVNRGIPCKDSPIIIYCKTGGRGALSTEALTKLGYTNVKNLNGGWEAWQKGPVPVDVPGEKKQEKKVEEEGGCG